MHGRVVRLKGDPTKVEEGIQNWKQQILPIIKKQKGFAGAVFLVNRKAAEALSVTYWETEQAMKDARGQIRPEAEKILTKTGGRIVEDDECEVAVQARVQPPKSGTWARVTTVEADRAKLDQGIADFKARAVPVLQKQPGARVAILLVNRQTGKSFAVSAWDTEKDLQNSEPTAAPLRREISEKISAKSPRVEVFEANYVELLAPALASR